jgi:predicted O-methyltransferase YrrM
VGTQLEGLLKEIEAFGAANDASITDRPRRMLNITRDTGEFLSVLVRVMSARRIPEIGTSNGYSTLWLAGAAQSVGGTVTTVELSALKVAMAKDSFARSGIASSIHQLHQDAGDVLAKSDDSAFDFIFLDSERSEYAGW